MADQGDQDKVFEEILSANDLNFADLDENQGKSSLLTLGDLYEGITNMSAMQADLYYFIKESLRVLYDNSKAGAEVESPPNMTRKQVGYLLDIFDLTDKFLTEQE